jgi:Zn-dependent protease
MDKIQELLFFVPALLISMTFHEAAHALAGYWLGDHTAKREGRISLNPLVHIDPLFTVLVPAVMIFMGLSPILAAKPVPFNPYALKYREFGAALLAVAGPLTNLLLAIFLTIVLRAVGDNGQTAANFLFRLISLNVSLAVFNLVPWPPLDGSRVLFALAPEPVQRVMSRIEAFGIQGLFIFIFIAYPVIGPFVGAVHASVMRILGF